jgi:hypothetical protein
METIYYDITGSIEAISIDVQEGYSQPVSRCSIVTPALGGLGLGDVIEVDMGFNSHHGKIFEGYITDISAERLPGYYTIEANDVLIRAVECMIVSTDLDNPFTRYNITAEDLVGDLLAEAGISSYSGDVTGFTFATGEIPIEFQLTFAWDAIQMVADVVAWHCYADHNGNVYFKDIDPIPSGAPVKTFRTGTGETILTARRSKSTDNLRNKIIVFGIPPITASASAASPYLPANFYKTAVISTTLIDTQPMADTTASYNLSKWNRLTENMSIESIGDYNIHARDTVAVIESFTNTNDSWFVHDITHSLGTTYSMRLNLVR